MTLNQFRNMFPDEGACRKYLEKVIWPSGRVCPHCGCLKSWLLAMYFIINSSKGISSVFLGKRLGINQKTAWKVGHSIRAMMASSN